MLLQIENLHIGLRGSPLSLVDGVSLAIDRGEVLALVGESGSGKTLTAMSIPRLLPAAVELRAGCVRFDGRDLASADDRALRAIRGRRIGVVFQEPMTSLNPLMTVGDQIAEPLIQHRLMRPAEARREAIALLARVGVPAPAERAHAWPHQLSGGMRQRVMIASAIACKPELLIADEPTTALDVSIQAQILDLLKELQRSTGMAILLITHDLAVVAHCAHRAAVMYAGRIAETATVAELFARPRHPYTQALLRCMPDFDVHREGRLPVISGEVANPLRRPAGCAFHPRCEFSSLDARCAAMIPELAAITPDRKLACYEPQRSLP